MLRLRSKEARPVIPFFAIAVVDGLAIAAGTALDVVLDQDLYLACGMSIAAIVLFVGLIYHALALRSGNTSDGISDAIACTFLAVYLVLVIYAVFFSTSPANAHLYPQTTSLLSSFTSVAAVVVVSILQRGLSINTSKKRKVSITESKSESNDNNPEKESVDLAGGTDDKAEAAQTS